MKKIWAAVYLILLLGTKTYGQFNNWVIDPQDGWFSPRVTIEEALITFEPKGSYTELGIYLVFSARGNEQLFAEGANLEVNYGFELPEKALVTDSWLWVEEDIIRAQILDRWTANTIYEGIVNRRRDPSLLVKENEREYFLQVYPMVNGSSRKVKITVLVPNEWTEKDVFSSLMPEWIVYSHEIPDLQIQVLVPEGTEVPELSSHPDLELLPIGTEGAKVVYGQRIPAKQLREGKPIVVRTAAPWVSGTYLAAYEKGNGGFYELAVMPATFLEQEMVVEPQRIMLLLQYDSPGSYGVSLEEYLAEIVQVMRKQLRPEDAFNVMVAGLTPEPIFEEWMPATEDNLDRTLEILQQTKISSNHLPVLIGSGIAWVQRQAEKGKIIVFANSTAEGEPTKANGLLAEIAELQAESDTIPCYIADYTYPGRYPGYYIEPNYFFGNAYFYINLARQSGGDWLEPDCCNRSFSLLSEAIFELALDERLTLDLFTTLDSGFTYNRFQLEDARGGTYHPLKPIFQYGRYAGKTPFLVEMAGFAGEQLFFQTLQPEIQAGDSLVETLWHGFQIRELEQETNNRSIGELINLSLEQRILSLYTAFLCLEPSLGGEPCPTCTDRSQGVVATEDIIRDSLLDVTFSPNPFSDQVSIRIEAPDGVRPDDIRIAIYDLAGREQMVFRELPEGTLYTLEFRWDGRNAAGQELPSGTYLLQLSGEQLNQSFVLIKHE